MSSEGAGQYIFPLLASAFGSPQAGQMVAGMMGNQQAIKLQKAERDEARKEKEIDRQDRRRELELVDLTRREDMARQDYQFRTSLAQNKQEAELRHIENLQNMDRLRNDFASESMLKREGLGLQKEQLALTKSEAEANRIRQAAQDVEISGLKKGAAEREEKQLGLAERQQKFQEAQAVLRPLHEMTSAILQHKLQASAQAQESAGRLEAARAMMAPEAVAKIAAEWASKGVDPAAAKDQLTDIFATMYGISHFGARAARGGDPEAVAKVEANLNAAMEQVTAKIQEGDVKGAQMLRDNAFNAANAALSGGMTKGEMPTLPADIKAEIEKAFGSGGATKINKAPKAGAEGTEDTARMAESFGVPRQDYESALAGKALLKGSVSQRLNAKYNGKDHTGWYSEWNGVPFKLPFGSQLEGATKEFKRDLIDGVASDPEKFNKLVEQAVRGGVIEATDDPRKMENAIKILNYEITHGIDMTM